MKQNFTTIKEMTVFLENLDNYTKEEKEVLQDFFNNAKIKHEPLKFTPLQKSEPLKLTLEQREKMLIDARNRINKELRQLRKQKK